MSAPKLSKSRSASQPVRGPIVYENWRASLTPSATVEAHETPLFTDAHITGEITEGYGPYRFLNSVPGDFEVSRLKPAIVVRVEDYYSPTPDEVVTQLQQGKTDDALYHGAGADEEIAALVSLALGIRCRAGGVSRLFTSRDDPRGRPVNWMIHTDPTLPPFRRPFRLPRALRTKALGELDPLLILPSIEAADAAVLIRVARLYQDAVWLAESQPELTWLMLVSAVEAAAGYWRQERESALERLRAWGPGKNVEAILREISEDLVIRVADLVAPYVGARRTFVDFLLTFCPDPPEDRPREAASMEPWRFGKDL